MRKPLLLLLPAVLLAGYVTLNTPSAYAQAANSGSHERAKKIYQVDCALCHGDAGDGKSDLAKDMGVTTNFTDPKALEGKDEKALFDLIRNGKDKMPGEDAGRAKDADIKALIQYLRSLGKGGTSPVAAPASAPATAAPAATAPAPTGN